MKKVLTIVSLSLVGLLLITTIVLACINVGSPLNLKTPNGVVVYSSDLGVGKSDEDAAAEDIINHINKGATQKYLQALFGGTLNSTRVTTSEARQYVSRNNSVLEKAVFEFQYDEQQKMTIQGKEISYYSIVFEVQESQERNTLKACFIPENTNSSSAPYYTAVEVDGNFGELFAYIRTLIESHM